LVVPDGPVLLVPALEGSVILLLLEIAALFLNSWISSEIKKIQGNHSLLQAFSK
jgi:hypothetical protein